MLTPLPKGTRKQTKSLVLDLSELPPPTAAHVRDVTKNRSHRSAPQENLWRKDAKLQLPVSAVRLHSVLLLPQQAPQQKIPTQSGSKIKSAAIPAPAPISDQPAKIDMQGHLLRHANPPDCTGHNLCPRDQCNIVELPNKSNPTMCYKLVD